MLLLVGFDGAERRAHLLADAWYFSNSIFHTRSIPFLRGRGLCNGSPKTLVPEGNSWLKGVRPLLHIYKYLSVFSFVLFCFGRPIDREKTRACSQEDEKGAETPG